MPSTPSQEKMDREECLRRLRECAQNDDAEGAHYDADLILLAYIGDPEIREAWDSITPKWWA